MNRVIILIASETASLILVLSAVFVGVMASEAGLGYLALYIALYWAADYYYIRKRYKISGLPQFWDVTVALMWPSVFRGHMKQYLTHRSSNLRL